MGNEEIRNEKSQKFFSDLTRVNCTQNIEGNINDLNEKISLNISLSGVSEDFSYQIQIFNIIGSSKSPLDQPVKLIPDGVGNARAEKAFLIQYYFEKEQPLLIEVIKCCSQKDPLVLPVNTTLGCIMGSRKNTLQKQISQASQETLIIAAEKIQQSNDILVVKFGIKANLPVDYKEIKNKIIYQISKNSPVYKSECISNEGSFFPVKIPAGLLSGNFSIKFLDCKKNVVANIETNINELINHKSFIIKMSSRRNFTCVSNSYITKNYTFVDYLKAGVQIGLSVAIDFTGSNGLPKEKSSLHYIGGPEPNQYERAINSCANIVAYYDYDQFFPCYGFGANINGQSCPIFNLNLTPDPNIQYVSNIIEAYHIALNTVRLWGPTHFSPILKSINQIIKAENDKLKYQILLILTDGMIDDVDETIEQLVEGSFLPLSVIIIGVGKADFSAMNVLDADENPLINSKGVKASRDLVQFVPFLKYEADPQKLASEVLAEVPKQIIEYYEKNNLDPVKLTT